MVSMNEVKEELRGLSFDEKPDGYPNGTKFVEIDTGAEFYYDEENHIWMAAGTRTVSELDITDAPTKTTYTEGEALDLTGITVSVKYSDATLVDVTAKCKFTPAEGTVLTTTDTKVTVEFGELTAEQEITVEAEQSEE